MGKKIGRNDPCPCGSGKKYKKCCLGKDDDPVYSNPINLLQTYKAARKSSRIKQCLYPDHSECSEKIIGAHSIQNNKVLKKISDNGEIYMPCPKADNPFAIPTKYGRKEASVFTGFCGYHDKVVFQAIEDNDFSGTAEQIFLYVYRAFAIEYHKKQEALEMEKFLFSKRPSLINANGFESPFAGMHLSISDLDVEKDIFDKALIEKRYDVLTSVVWKFPHFSNFAASGLEAPSRDIDGNQIQDLLNKQQNVGHIFYSVFPENDATYAIIAWAKIYDNLFEPIKKRLQEFTEQERKNYINNTLPITCENIAIKPSAWEKMSETEKEEFGALFWGLSELAELSGEYIDRTSAPMYDMFSS